MKIVFRDNDCTEVWDGVFYKKLSNYPIISDWELQTIADFISYEKIYGRECEIEGTKEQLEQIYGFINLASSQKENKRIKQPDKIEECTACPKYKGCMTDLVCHTTSIDNAIKILKCGSLLSPVKARNMNAQELMKEARNAAGDPADYFDYIMFAWGNCQAGDRLVMERKLKRFPNKEDLSLNFEPGIRFFFDYEKLAKHPNVIFEGVLPMKVKDEVKLSDWVKVIIVPEKEKANIEKIVPDNLKNKVPFVPNDCQNIWQWSEKVYELAREY